MRVLIVTSTFPLHPDDGMPRFVFDLAMALSDTCTVTVLAPHSQGAQMAETIGGLRIERFRYARPAGLQQLAYGDGMRENMRASYWSRCLVPAYLFSLTAAVRRLMRNQRFDVINSHWLVPQALAVSAALGLNSGCAHVVTVHAGDVFLLGKLPLGKRIVRYIVRRTDRFLPVGRHVGERLTSMAGQGVPCAIQPMGVDYRRFSGALQTDPAALPFGGNFVLFVGRLVEKKGAAHLLQAMVTLLGEFPRLGMVVIGSGPLEAHLKHRAERLGIQNSVRFTGRLGHADLLTYLNGCRVVAIPSIVDSAGDTEGVPTVLSESLAAGCHVVATRVSGIPDVVSDGCNGWLADPGAPADLARALRRALLHQGRGVREKARQTAAEMDWLQIARCYRANFEIAIRQRGTGR